MTLRIAAALPFAFALSLAGCTTISPATNAVESRWNGQPAGTFFAQFGPPISDVQSGDSTLYTWKGGYRTRRVETAGGEGAKGKRATRTQRLSCTVQLTVTSDYVIRSIRTISDVSQPGGPSWCEEFLGGAKGA
ncbi:hypothetical protein ACLE20_00885 [Rhizobium sp. YIM 134829]|uniref:hypothetical protein n=1 Tax=Rhizobium sp. YIM 134829 TaxID=3390453 RepID=UPI0039787D2C